MSSVHLTRIAAKTAEEVCRKFTPSPEARALLTPEAAPAPYLEALCGAKLFADAAAFLAAALPKREAVWWACCCLRAALTISPKSAVSLAAAEKWVIDPVEANRRAAMTAAEQTGFDDPAGLAALAAFWSGGSLAPEKFEPVPPPDHLTARGVAGAIMLAGVAEQPEKAPEKYLAFLDIGREIAAGRRPWKS
jgi:hypothetical protein